MYKWTSENILLPSFWHIYVDLNATLITLKFTATAPIWTQKADYLNEVKTGSRMLSKKLALFARSCLDVFFTSCSSYEF